MNYLRRDVNGTLISINGSIEHNLRSVKYLVNEMCVKNLSTYEGRTKAIAKIFNYKTLTPIFINTSLFLFPTASLREYNMIFINYEEVLSYVKYDYKTKITFNDLTSLIVDASYYKISNQIKRIKIIKKYHENYEYF